ncbi:MAG TPA: MFS transporter [Pseudonocardiaceae bacterium]|jgi:MFS family permease|nr:MFS transporter [Pseudonocardiaceae bacterium]
MRTERTAFPVVIALMLLYQAAASAPTPLYVVYQRMWGFSSAVVTLVFATFVFGLLCSLLVLGGLSDRVGRRPVLVASIAVEAVAVLMFLVAGNVTVLVVARAVQGVATGAVLPALGATLVDIDPRRAAVANGVVPIGGLALGSLATGALAQYGPDPTHLVWALLLGAMVLAFPAVFTIPAARRPDVPRSVVPRPGVPRRLRPDVYALVPVIVASWALGGLYLSLGPSAAAGVFGITSHLVGGLVATLLCGTGAVTAFALRTTAKGIVLRLSVSLLTAGTAVTLLGALGGSVGFAVVGTLVAGVGYGASGLATLGGLAVLGAGADVFAFAYLVAYLSFSVPAVAAGYASAHVGLHATVVVYSVVVVAIGLAALAVLELRRKNAGRSASTVNPIDQRNAVS